MFNFFFSTLRLAYPFHIEFFQYNSSSCTHFISNLYFSIFPNTYIPYFIRNRTPGTYFISQSFHAPKPYFLTLRLAPHPLHIEFFRFFPPRIQISFFLSIFKPLFPRLQFLDHFSTSFEVRLAHLPLPRTLLVPRPPLFQQRRAATRPFVERSIPRPRGHRSVPTLTRYVTITGSRIGFQPRFSPSSVIVIFGESGTAYISLQGRITNLLPLPLLLSKSVAQSCLRISTGLNRLQIGRDELDSIQRRSFLSRDDGWGTRLLEFFQKTFFKNLNEWNLRILVELKAHWRTCHFWNLEKFNWNDDSSDFSKIFFRNLYEFLVEFFRIIIKSRLSSIFNGYSKIISWKKRIAIKQYTHEHCRDLGHHNVEF